MQGEFRGMPVRRLGRLQGDRRRGLHAGDASGPETRQVSRRTHRQDRRRAGARRLSLHRTPAVPARQDARHVGPDPLVEPGVKPRAYTTSAIYTKPRSRISRRRASGRCWTWRSRTRTSCARRSAPARSSTPPGHQEIEIGLAKLYRVTGEEKYLETGEISIATSAVAPETHGLYGAQQQDHLPVLEQAEAVGHAVRAGYMYAGMADVAALTGDDAYVRGIDRLWEDVVACKLHLTGGIGAGRGGEAFGGPYDLPNGEAYLETCAAIANALWNHRMFLLHGDAEVHRRAGARDLQRFSLGRGAVGRPVFLSESVGARRRVAVQPRPQRARAVVRLFVLPGQRGALHPVDRRLHPRHPRRRAYT